jgi:hypothetical protein
VVLDGASSAVNEALQVTEAESQLVVAKIAARLRDEQRDQRLAESAVVAAKSMEWMRTRLRQ